MDGPYWIVTDFGKIPVPFDPAASPDAPYRLRIGRDLKPAELQAMAAAQAHWAAGGVMGQQPA